MEETVNKIVYTLVLCVMKKIKQDGGEKSVSVSVLVYVLSGDISANI